ncbi:MAG: DUF2911 domain-containing protein [Thermoanaerobaculia bacterium]
MGRTAATGLLSIVLAASAAVAERGDDADRVSKNGRAEGTVDGISVVLEYGRPEVRGREIWGGLVPYGEVWRTGANEATTLELGSDALIEGEPLAAGRYGLFTVPGEEEWVVAFNRVADQWGAFDYDAAEDALRVTVEPRAAEHVEAMDFEITESGIALRWAELAVPVSISAP